MDDSGMPDPGPGGLAPESSCWPPPHAALHFFGGGDRSESSILSDFWPELIHPEFVQAPAPVPGVDDEFHGESSSLQEYYANADFGEAASPVVGRPIGSAGDKGGRAGGCDASTSSSTEDLPEPSDPKLLEPTGGKVMRRRKKGEKRMKQPRVAFVTKSQADNLEDGYRWRKYGQKAVKNSPFPRSYYRCTNTKCTVKKRVERSYEDPSMVITTYEGQHCHFSAGFPRAAAGNHEAMYANTRTLIAPNSHDALLRHPARMPFPGRNTSTSNSTPPQFHNEAALARAEVLSQVGLAPNHIDHDLPADHGLLGDIVGVSRSAQPADEEL